MKKFNKTVKATACIAMAAALALSGAACGGRGDEQVDAEKSQLYIGSWNGDFHLTWLTEIAERFMAENAETEFEPGKKGVQVWVNPGSYTYDSVATSISGDTNDIIVSEQGNYMGFVNKQSALDITDAVTTPLTEYGESKSIADKMQTQYWDYYGIGESENRNERKYYGLPWYETYMGLTYDKEVFEEENLYFAAEGEGRDGFVVNAKTKKSNGPDGVSGTEDDGLPATYDEFFKLLDKMYDLGMEPVAWGGNAQVYINNFLCSLAADYEGYDSMLTNYTFTGTTKIVSSINADGSVNLEDFTVTPQEGYKLKQQAGYYYGLKFIERLLTTKDSEGNPKYYDPNHSTTSGYTHRMVQSTFLRAGYVEGVNKRIGILLDGSWWHSGAEDIFATMSSIEGGSALERDFGFMPIPKVDEDHLGEATYFNNWMSNVTVRGNVDSSKISLCKQFIRYMHTDKSLSAFTRLTSSVRPFEYSLTAEDAAVTTTFGKQQLAIHTQGNVVSPWSKTPLMLNNYSAFVFNETVFTSIVNGASNNLISVALRTGVSAKDYFEGFKKQYSQENWNNNYSQYF